MASGVTRVIERCERATESEHLDLSECQLVQMPDAVFHLMRNTSLQSCNLSCNLISRIPAKLGVQFVGLRELDLSNNRLGKLPEEIKALLMLQRLNISHNAFLSMPSLIYELPELRVLEARKNFITDVNVTALMALKYLELADIRDNPLSPNVHNSIAIVQHIKILVTQPQKEEWDVIPGEDSNTTSE